MDYSFPHYLLSKQSVDDRAINRSVYEALKASLPSQPLRIMEVGAGIGTMLRRLLRWGLFQEAEYLVVDEMVENIAYASTWIPQWADENRLQVERRGENRLRLFDVVRDVCITLIEQDVFAFIQSKPAPADILIAHAFLDLLPLLDALPALFSLLHPAGLAWLTINYDGLTSFEPPVDPQLDASIERLYHRTMDERPSGGDSQTGRHLFGHLKAAGVELLASGASDWVVHPVNGQYPADEAYFLNFILHFFEQSLTDNPELDPTALKHWLAVRRAQVESGELVYIAHQIDFLVRV